MPGIAVWRKRIDCCHILGRKRKIKNLRILFHTRRIDRFWERDDIMLQFPAQNDLRNASTIWPPPPAWLCAASAQETESGWRKLLQGEGAPLKLRARHLSAALALYCEAVSPSRICCPLSSDCFSLCEPFCITLNLLRLPNPFSPLSSLVTLLIIS